MGLLGLCASSFALPSYDPFSNAVGQTPNGTAYADASPLYHQTNAFGEGWVLWNGGSGSSVNEVMCVNSNLAYAGFPAAFPAPSPTNSILVPGLAQGQNAGGYSAALSFSRVIQADPNNLVTNKIYASFLLSVTNIGDLATTGTEPIYFGGFNNSTSGDVSGTIPPGKSFKMFLQGNSATAGSSTMWDIGIADNSGGSTERFDPTFRTAGTVLFVVVDYEFGINGSNDNANLWVNPGATSFGTATPPTATTNITITAASGNEVGEAAKFFLFNRGGNTLWGSILLDDLRVGTTWSFVTGGPEFTNQPVSQSDMTGATVVFNGTAVAGGSAVSYQWQFNGANLTNGGKFSGVTSASLTIGNAVATNAGSYSLVATDPIGSVTSSNAVLTITNLDPSIVSPPQNTSVVAGGTAQFSVTPGGTAPFSYFWQFNGINMTNGTLPDGAVISGVTFSNLTIANVTAAEAGSYSVVVTNIHGSITSAAASLTVVPAMQVTSPLQSRVEAVGDNMAFVVGVNNTASYQWQFDGTNIAGATNSSLALTNIQTGNAGTYTVMAAGLSGTVSNSATLSVATGRLHLSPANLVVLRVGDGAQTLSSSTGNTMYLDQIATNGAYVSTIMVPNSGPPALVVPGTGDGIYEGVLNLSENGQFLNFAGYNVSYPYAGPDVTAGGVTIRGIAAVNGLGYYTLVLTNIGLYSGGNHFIRSAASTDGLTNFWTTGAASSAGIKYIAPGLDANGQGIPAVGGGDPGTRVVQVYQGTLVFSDSEDNTSQTGVNMFDDLPMGTASSSLLFPTGASSDPNDFAISPDGNTVYIADDSPSDSYGIQRWDFNQVDWSLTYTLGTSDAASVGARGLTVDFTQFSGDGASGSGAVVYATTAEASGNRLISIVDFGPNSPATVLDMAGPNQMLRGVRFGPAAAQVYFAAPPQSQTNAPGANVIFSANVTGSQPISYQWQFNGSNIAGATTAALTVSNAAPTNAGTYTLLASNDISATNASATLTLLVDTNAPAVVGAQSLGLSEVELMFSVILTPDTATNASNYTLTGLEGPLSILNAAQDASGSNIFLTVSAMTNGGNYLVTASNLANAYATNSILPPNSQTNFVASFYTPVGIGTSVPSQTVLSNGLIVSATGSLLNGTNDQTGFSGQMFSGNFDLCVNLASLGAADVWSEAGLMARQSLAVGDVFAASIGTPGMSGCFFDYRSATNGTPALAGSFPANMPNTWLRLSRVGSLFTGYASYNGQTWTELGSASIAMTDPIYVGLAVTSNDTNATTSAQFLNLESTPTNAVVGPNTNPHEPIGPCSRKTGIIVSEIMWKPAPRADTNNCEYLEIYNTQPYFHDISGYQITCADMNYTFPPNTTIAAGAYLVIAASPGSIENVYGITNVMGPYNGSLKHSETLELLDEQSNILLTIPYTDTYPWPVAAAGTGHSLVLANPSYGEGDPRAWDISDIVGGSPGTAECYRPSPLRNVVINEFLAHSENSNVPQFIELYNHSTNTVDISGCILTDNPQTNLFVVPAGTTLGPAGFVSFNQSQLGFQLNGSGDTIYFIKPDGSRVLDAVQFEPQADGVSFGRWPDGANDFYPFTAATPGTNNSSIVIGTIVINELMYDPISGNDDDQYIELYNDSTNAVSLANWQFTAGVTFTFPTNAVIGPHGYVVVAKNMTNLFAKYTNLNTGNTYGNYSGKLSHSGELVELSQPETYYGSPINVMEDEVTYGTGGRWGQWSSGNGSSLELIDPHSNHRLAANWTDSDDTQKSQWVTISNTGVLDNGTNYTSGITYAEVGILDAGECLVDNVQVNWEGTNYVTNSTFENGLGGWNFQGDCIRSSLEPSGYQSSYSLHVRSSDKFWQAENSCQVALPSNKMGAGDTVTLQFQARWLHGWPEPVLHLDGNWLEAYGAMPVPSNLGTPGMPNSAYVTNAGPAIYNVTHTPSLPAAGQAAVVTAQIHDPDGVTNFTLYYRIDPSTNYTAVPMVDNGTGGDAIAGDGIFSASIPGQAANVVVAFYLSATDSLGASTRFPALRPANNEPVRECVVEFGDNTTTSSFGVYHLWLTQTNIQRWIQLADLGNEYMDCTFVNNSRVIYNMGGRFSTSPAHQNFTSPVGNLCTYEWEFNDDDMFLGATSYHKVHVPGNGGLNDQSLQREQTSYTFMRALGLPWLYRRNVVLYVNGNRRGPMMEDTQLPDSDMVKEYFPNDDDGWLYKFDQWYEFSAQPSGVSIGYAKERTHTILPYTTTGGVLKTTAYRPLYQVRRSPDSLNDFTNVFALVDAANSYGTPNYVQNMENLADMENWMGNFAVNHAVGNWDVFGGETGQNLYGYVGAAGTKWHLMMWDMNIDLGSGWGPGQNLFVSDVTDTNIENIFNCPTFRRMYWRAFERLINGQFSVNAVAPLADAKYKAFINDNMSPYISGGIEDPNTAMLPWIAEAQSSIASQLAAVDATQFTVNPTVTVTNDVAYISGVAPVAVDTVWINGVAWPITWTTLTNWIVAMPLQPGTNLFYITGVDINGTPISGDTGSVSVTYNGQVASSYAGQVVINEIMYDSLTTNANYVELYNNSTSNTFNLSGWQLQGVGYTFPAGSEIGPNQFLILAENGQAFAGAYGGTIPVFDEYPGALQPPQTLTLLDVNSNVVAEVLYESVPPWPTEPNNGTALELIDPTQDNWREGNWQGTGLSPGATNTVYASLPAFQPLWINEVLADNITSITNSAGQHVPWIEIYNPTSNSVSLNGLYLTDNYSDRTNWAFPSSATIASNQFLIVFADSQTNLNTATELHAGFTLPPSAGSVALSRLYNGQPQVLDYMDYTNLPPNYSYGDFPDGQSFAREQFYDTTPGGPNNGSLPGAIPYFAMNSVYTQNFDSLPDPGSTTVQSDNPVTINGTTYTPGNPLNFAAAVANGGLGLSATMPGWYGSAAIGMKLGASAGDQSTGGVISFGPTDSANTNRALGLLATSSTGGTAFSVAFLNETTNTLNQITLSYIGELWRQQPTAKMLAFSYYIDPTGTSAFTTNGSLTAAPALNVNFPTGAMTVEDGTQPGNQIFISATNQAIADWPPGAALWLVWQMTSDTGNAQGMAIDNFSFSANSTYVPPVIVTQPQSQTVNSGNNPQFSITVSSAFPVSYQWQENTTNLPDETNAVLALNDVSTNDQGSYDVIVSNQYGATNSAVAILTVNEVTGLAVISPQPLSQTDSIGSNALFFISASGSPPLTYQWMFDNNPIPGATSTSLLITNLSMTNAGTYFVQVTDTAGPTNSSNAVLTVLAIPPSITAQPVSQTVPAGITVTLSVGATGTMPLTYQWFRGATALNNGVSYSGATNSTLTINNIQAAQTGTYTVTVTNSGGSAVSQPAIINLIGPSYAAYTNAGSVYVQNFDSLPNPGANTVNTANPVTISGTNYSLANPVDLAYPVLSSGNGGFSLSNTMPGWFGYCSVAMKAGASAGDQSTGGIISFGPTTSADTNRSLGLLATGTSGATAFAVRILNLTPDTLTNMNLSFTGELWRQQTTAKSLAFSYYVDPTGSNTFSVNNITSNLTALNVSFPTGSSTSGTSGPILTNFLAVTNQVISNCPPGAALWLIWQMTSDTSGGQGIGIDNLSFSATGPETEVPYLNIVQSNVSVIISWQPGITNYTLQSNSIGLFSTNAWQPVTAATNSSTVVLPITGSSQFFRLQH